MKRSFLVLGLSVFAVFGSGVAGFPGSGALCTLVLAFLAGIGWGAEKVIIYARHICSFPALISLHLFGVQYVSHQYISNYVSAVMPY